MSPRPLELAPAVACPATGYTRPHARFHDLRHSYPTRLVSAGVPVNDVAEVLGHEQTSTTLDRYTHPSRDRDGRVRSVFADFPLTPATHQGPGNASGAPAWCP